MRYRCNMAAADTAYTFTKERILDGRLRGGDRISEGEIAQDTGLSRTPVREAFLRLEGEGLLRLYPKRGALVVPVSASEIGAVMEARVLVERFAVQAVIQRELIVTGALIDVIERQEQFLGADDAWAFAEADHEFHRIIVAAADNEVLLQLHDSMRDRQSRMGWTALMRNPHRARTILHEHRAITAAVLTRDEQLGLSLIDQHLAATLALLQSPEVTE